jgi:hypothetical protein
LIFAWRPYDCLPPEAEHVEGIGQSTLELDDKLSTAEGKVAGVAVSREGQDSGER